MDIVRAFEHAFSVDGFHLNIIGAVEDPHQIDLATKDVVSKQAASQKGVVINCITSRDGCYWFQANHVAKSIDLSNIRDSIKFFEDGSEKMTVEASTNGGKQKLLFLSENGVKKLIVRSRKPIALVLAKAMGFTTFDCKVATIEASTILQIMQAFDGHEMKHQFMVNKYLIDLYFPQFNLAIECDEHHHNVATNRKKDAMRQADICETNGQCTFIRYSPYEKDFNIFQVINKILNHILACVNK